MFLLEFVIDVFIDWGGVVIIGGFIFNIFFWRVVIGVGLMFMGFFCLGIMGVIFLGVVVEEELGVDNFGVIFVFCGVVIGVFCGVGVVFVGVVFIFFGFCFGSVFCIRIVGICFDTDIVVFVFSGIEGVIVVVEEVVVLVLEEELEEMEVVLMEVVLVL